MSCLDYPRVHFNGMFSTNVCTANNDDMGSVSTNVGTPQHPAAGAIADEFYPIVDPVRTTLNGNIAKMTRDEARQWFGSKSKGGAAPNAGWNYYGDHVVKFQNASVSQVQTAPAGQTQLATALVHTQVSLPGAPKMVDVDPTGSVNTQIFFGGFSLGTRTAGITYSNDKSRDGLVGYTRWIGGRNVSARGFTAAAATWQFGIPNGEELTFAGAEDDPALKLLMDRAAAAKGLLVQFCVYYAQPLISNQQLVQDFADGKSTQNPAIGHLVGTVGVWGDQDFATLPNGRLLNPSPDAAKTFGRNSVFLGPAVAKMQVGQGVASLNLITTFPEQLQTTPSEGAGASARVRAAGTSAFPPLEKVPFGQLSLWVRAADGTEAKLGDLADYDDYDAYVASAGVMDVKLGSSPSDASQGDLVVKDENGVVLLEEQPLVAETDDHALYLSQGDTGDVQVNVRLRGEPVTGSASIAVQAVPSTYGFNAQGFPNVFQPPAGATDARFGSKIEGGAVSGTVTAVKNPALLVLDCTLTTSESPGASAGFSVSLRIHPEEDYSDKPAGDRSWDEIYDIVMKYYDYVFPAMSEILDLSDEGLVVSQAGAFLYLLETSFNNPQYMPVTRSMPPARRQLLIDWLNARTGV